MYLRFVVGVALTCSENDIERDQTRWHMFETVVSAVLSARLQVPVRVEAKCRGSLYETAHDGLREYQAARLGRIVKALDGGRGVSAQFDPSNPDSLRRVRLALLCGRSTLAACTLQTPLDEGPAQMQGRIANWLCDQGVTSIITGTVGSASGESSFVSLAVPI